MSDAYTTIPNIPVRTAMQAARIVKIPAVVGNPDLFTGTKDGGIGVKFAEQ
jgi:hypothetical protein